VATAVAAQGCGYVPWFADIDPCTLALDPVQVAALPVSDRVGVVLVVAPYGRMVDIQQWQDFTQQTGIPVVVDAAACFDTLSPALIARLQVPVAVSLHATKTLSSAEGGIMMCGDSNLVRRATAALNFGFETGRISTLPGANGKMSEFHAMVGLADLDGWQEKRAGFLRATASYCSVAATLEISTRIIVNPSHAVPYAHVLAADADEARRITLALDRDAIEWRLWYGTGLHPQPVFAQCPQGNLATTEDIAPRLIGLPMSVDLTLREVERTLRSVASVIIPLQTELRPALQTASRS
jgi:dTDP-4-amino-4,6-dideoxygalactose transaminase